MLLCSGPTFLLQNSSFISLVGDLKGKGKVLKQQLSELTGQGQEGELIDHDQIKLSFHRAKKEKKTEPKSSKALVVFF